MIIVGNAVISDDVADEQFVCHLEKCKGACCIEGDSGAPLETDEVDILEREFEQIAPYLSEDGLREIRKQGKYVTDVEGDLTTPTISGRECAYAVYDKKGHLKCGIEQAWIDGKTTFKKPISCHLYPIRVTRYDHYEALNYHRWHICRDACNLGKSLQVPVYKFLKDALTRKYGTEWYSELERQIEVNRKDKTQ
jgi:hypothetical protein